MKTQCKIVTKIIAKWTQQETKMNINVSSTQFSKTHLPQARSGLLPQAIEIKQKSDELCIEQNSKNGLHQGVQGGSNEPAFHSQNSVWDPLGIPRGARTPPEGPLDDF